MIAVYELTKSTCRVCLYIPLLHIDPRPRALLVRSSAAVEQVDKMLNPAGRLDEILVCLAARSDACDRF